MTNEEYCNTMRDCRSWGGGPEIVALSTHFQCPIFVYQLCASRTLFPWQKASFEVELSACFGSPHFDRINSPIHLLCADGRYPSIIPGQQKELGDHFLALFPCYPAKTSFLSSVLTKIVSVVSSSLPFLAGSSSLLLTAKGNDAEGASSHNFILEKCPFLKNNKELYNKIQ